MGQRKPVGGEGASWPRRSRTRPSVSTAVAGGDADGFGRLATTVWPGGDLGFGQAAGHPAGALEPVGARRGLVSSSRGRARDRQGVFRAHGHGLDLQHLGCPDLSLISEALSRRAPEVDGVDEVLELAALEG